MQIYNPSYSFTRPADTTQYADNDLVANSTTAGSVVPMSFQVGANKAIGIFSLNRVRLVRSQSSVTTASFRLHLYSALPAVTNGDNAAFESTKAANYLGYISVDATTLPGDKFSDGSVGVGSVPAEGTMHIRLSAGSTVYALLEAKGTYTPADSEVFTTILELVEQR